MPENTTNDTDLQSASGALVTIDWDLQQGFSSKAAQNILRQYLTKHNPSPEENEAAYASLVQLPAFLPWDKWVPMPHPHREIAFARGMYMRGEKLTV